MEIFCITKLKSKLINKLCITKKRITKMEIFCITKCITNLYNKACPFGGTANSPL